MREIRALRKAADLQGTQALYRDFVLAMARWRLGEREQASTVYDDAVRILRSSQGAQSHLVAVAREAAALLGRQDPVGKDRSP